MNNKYVVLQVIDNLDYKKIEFIGVTDDLDQAKSLAVESYNEFWCEFNEDFQTESLNFSDIEGGSVYSVDDEDFQYSIQIIEKGKALTIE